MTIFFYCKRSKGVKLFGEYRDWPCVPPIHAEVYLSGATHVFSVLRHHWCDHVDGDRRPIKDKPMVTVQLKAIRKAKPTKGFKALLERSASRPD